MGNNVSRTHYTSKLLLLLLNLFIRHESPAKEFWQALLIDTPFPL